MRVTTPAAGMVLPSRLQDLVQRRAVGQDAGADPLDGLLGRDEAGQQVELRGDGHPSGEDGVSLVADLVDGVHQLVEEQQDDRDHHHGEDEVAHPPQSHVRPSYRRAALAAAAWATIGSAPPISSSVLFTMGTAARIVRCPSMDCTPQATLCRLPATLPSSFVRTTRKKARTATRATISMTDRATRVRDELIVSPRGRRDAGLPS